MDQAGRCDHQLAHGVATVLMVTGAAGVQPFDDLVDGFRGDAVLDHAVVAAHFGGAAPAEYQAHAQFVGRLPHGVFQLWASACVV